MIAVIDYDAGNIMSVRKACDYLGFSAETTRDQSVIEKADHVILPGVGAFGDAMEHLRKYSLIQVIHDVISKGTPFLGICLGLQVLFSGSEESPGTKGLEIFEGDVRRIPESQGLKVPNIGWNSTRLSGDGRLFSGIPDEPYFYFVHSYYLRAKDPQIVKARIDYGGTEVDASVEKDNVFACQFHPEKSGETGLSVLKNFLEL